MLDLLHDRLVHARASGGVFARSAAIPPWGLTLPGSIQLSVHTVTRGQAFLWLDGDTDAAVRLRPGLVALVVGGRPHHLAAEADQALCVPHELFWERRNDAGAEDGPGGDVFLCGAYALAGDIGRDLVRALPELLLIDTEHDERIGAVVALLSAELAVLSPGQQTVLDRLLDVLLVLALRRAYSDSSGAPAWFRAGQDPRLGPALRAMHEEPERRWTVPELARVSTMSRPAFARAFEQALGQTPMRYLTDWRLALAREYLLARDLSIEQIAVAVGYGSANAFAAAFHRHVGTSPGQWRREAGATVG